MCLFPRLLRNKRYLPTKKNNYNPPILANPKFKYVAVGCGQCIECRKQIARGWLTRMLEEARTQRYRVFCTFSFSPQALNDLVIKYTIQDVNDVATKAMRLFLERYRKKHKKSIKHWFITELGHTNTERIHLHGILFSKEPIDTETITKLWAYGNTYIGDYCNEKTINYIVKYMLKVDEDHKGYMPKILCSKGIGANYVNSHNGENNQFKGKTTKETYTLPNGQVTNLPIYYRNKIYTEDERQQLWEYKLDKHEIYVLGQKYNISNDKGRKIYEKVLKNAQIHNRELGYGDLSEQWNKKQYKVTLEMLNKS